MVFRVSWEDIRGRLWPMHSGSGGAAVFIERDGLSGLVGSVEVVAHQVPGRPGRVVRGAPGVVGPVEGSLQLVFTSLRARREFLAGWSLSREGRLWLQAGGREFFLPCRLGGPVSSPQVRPREVSRVELRVVGDGGVWWCRVPPASGVVTVTNWGEVFTYPKVEWGSTQVVVTVPSGGRFQLPAAPSGDRLSLSLAPEGSLTVVNQQGVVNRQATEVARRAGLCEGVPPGGTARFEVSGGTLSYDVGVLDPWNGGVVL